MSRIPGALFWVAVGLGFSRLVHLGLPGLWIDEAHTLHDALGDSSGAALRYPLGFWLVRLVSFLTGGATDEAALRLGPALLGWATIPLSAWTFLPLLGRFRAGLSALLLAVSPWHLYWSQCARGYTLMLALTLLGAGIWLRAQTAGPKNMRGFWGAWRPWVGFALGCAAVLAHPSALLTVLAWLPAAWLAARQTEPDRAGVTAQALPRAPRAARRWPPTWPQVLVLLLVAAAGLWAADSWYDFARIKRVDPLSGMRHLVVTAGYQFDPVLLAAALCGLWWTQKPNAQRHRQVAWVIVVAGLTALALASLARVGAQYLFALLPWVCALASVAFPESWSLRRVSPAKDRWLALAGACLCCLALIHGAWRSWGYFHQRHGDRPRWKEAYQFVRNARASGDWVFGMHSPVGEYYFDPNDPRVRMQQHVTRLDSFSPHGPKQATRRARTMWIVMQPADLATWAAQDRAEFGEFLAGGCERVLRLEVPGTPRDLALEVWRWPRRP